MKAIPTLLACTLLCGCSVVGSTKSGWPTTVPAEFYPPRPQDNAGSYALELRVHGRSEKVLHYRRSTMAECQRIALLMVDPKQTADAVCSSQANPEETWSAKVVGTNSDESGIIVSSTVGATHTAVP